MQKKIKKYNNIYSFLIKLADDYSFFGYIF
ncbi:MAG: hypothetical protein QG634_504, partial [Patescibacteria group bacterium]|nr:hypothetical protein [Patescibacteria group bacterium]